LDSLSSAWNENQSWIEQLSDQLRDIENECHDNMGRLEDILVWLQGKKAVLETRNNVDLPLNDLSALYALKYEHEHYKAAFLTKQHDFDDIIRIYKKVNTGSRIPIRSNFTQASPQKLKLEFTHVKAHNLHQLWQKVWLISIDRQRNIEQAIENAEIVDFDFDAWRTRYMKFIKHKKSRVMDQMRKMDKNGSGFITNERFIRHMLESNFKTSKNEMEEVVRLFDLNNDGKIDYYEFISSLNPRVGDAYKDLNEADKIEDEVIREVAQCRCCDRFGIEQITDNKYRFGDSQQLRLVRILKNSVMVRVGGGWASLQEFLTKNDPCRAKKTKKKKSQPANLYDPMAEGLSQGMASFSRRTRNISQSSAASSPAITNLRFDSRASSQAGSTVSSRAGSRDPSPVSRIPIMSPRSRRKQISVAPSHDLAASKLGLPKPTGIRMPSSYSPKNN